jgi:hypothetical protein
MPSLSVEDHSDEDVVRPTPAGKKLDTVLLAAVAAPIGRCPYFHGCPYLKARKIESPYTVADAVARLIKYRAPVAPNPMWQQAYREGLRVFEQRL